MFSNLTLPSFTLEKSWLKTSSPEIHATDRFNPFLRAISTTTFLSFSASEAPALVTTRILYCSMNGNAGSSASRNVGSKAVPLLLTFCQALAVMFASDIQSPTMTSIGSLDNWMQAIERHVDDQRQIRSR